MTYLPKYILKRMFPQDCLALTRNGFEIAIMNVISPLDIGSIGFSEISIDGREYSINQFELHTESNQIIAVGEKFLLCYKGECQLKVGHTAKIKFKMILMAFDGNDSAIEIERECNQKKNQLQHTAHLDH